MSRNLIEVQKLIRQVNEPAAEKRGPGRPRKEDTVILKSVSEQTDLKALAKTIRDESASIESRKLATVRFTVLTALAEAGRAEGYYFVHYDRRLFGLWKSLFPESELAVDLDRFKQKGLIKAFGFRPRGLNRNGEPKRGSLVIGFPDLAPDKGIAEADSLLRLMNSLA